jgi:hypothetical protein
VSMVGGKRRVLHAQTWERGPTSALAEFFLLFISEGSFKIA